MHLDSLFLPDPDRGIHFLVDDFVRVSNLVERLRARDDDLSAAEDVGRDALHTWHRHKLNLARRILRWVVVPLEPVVVVNLVDKLVQVYSLVE